MPGEAYRVRVYRYSESGEPTTDFEGLTTFTVSAAPSIRRRGITWPRWRIEAECLPGKIMITGSGPAFDGYSPGGTALEFGERFTVCLLDREDPEVKNLRAPLEMALDVFMVSEGVTSIQWSDPSD